MKYSPPKLPLRFFRWFCHPKLLKYIEGDLMELYEERVKEKGKRRADLKFIVDVLMLFRPGIIRPAEGYQQINNYGMLKSYFKIGLRNLIKDKVYSFINITGLCLGITVSVLILIFVLQEYSYDRFHQHGNEIFRAEKKFSRDGRHSLYANPDFGPTLKEMDPHIVNYVRLYNGGEKVVMSDDKHKFFEERFLFSDTSFFSVFSFEIEKGEKSSLVRPNTLVITEKAAEQYFGTTDVIGKIISYDKSYTFEIVAIAKNPPVNSSLQFDFIASFSSLRLMPENDLLVNNSSGFPTYIQLAHKEDLPEVEKSILKTTYTNKSIEYSLSPLFENHFNLNFKDATNTRYIFIFLCVGLLVLVLALVNYMSLTTARAATRAKEVGVRKAIGAHPKTLLYQFYIESAITTIIAFLLAIILVSLCIPVLESMMQQQVDIEFLKSPLFVGSAVSILILCIVLAGSYPAIVLPQFKPVDVLRGKFSGKGQGAWIRKGLTVFQFSVSIGLIICTLIMQHQVSYLQSKEIGIQREQVMVVPVDMLPAKSYQSLRGELLKQTGIVSVGMASVPLFKADMSGVSLVTSPITNEKVGTKWIIVDKEFLDVLGIQWQTKPESNVLHGNHIINETAAVAFGSQNAVDYRFSMGDDHAQVVDSRMVGIVKDFNYQGLRTRIEPLVMTIAKDISLTSEERAVYLRGALYIGMGPQANLSDKVGSIGKLFENFSNDTPYSYYFLDDAFNDLHLGEKRLGHIFIVFTSVALSIAFLGLFGLVTFTTERRTKEISIRKVLGGSITSVWQMLSKDFVVLVTISCAIAIPMSFYLMNEWLQGYEYRTEIPVWIYVAASMGALLVTLLIVSYQVIKAARMNPAKSLRSE